MNMYRSSLHGIYRVSSCESVFHFNHKYFITTPTSNHYNIVRVSPFRSKEKYLKAGTSIIFDINKNLLNDKAVKAVFHMA